MSDFGFKRSDLELDYLKFNGTLIDFSARKDNHRAVVQKYVESIGFIEGKCGDDWVSYANRDMGMRAFFSDFPMNNKKAGRRPTLTFEFSGQFFIRHNADLLIREMIKNMTEKFGAFFKISRVDIRQDVYGAKYPFDYLPDWTNTKNHLIWALRGQPVFNLYNHDFSNRSTGLSIKTSRYKIMSYNRNMVLEKKVRNGEISNTYYRHYKRLYGSRDVQRLEVQLRQDACDFFAILFFGHDYDKNRILRMTMANFGRNHSLKTIEPGKSLDKMSVEKTFSELFFLEDKPKVKLFKVDFEQKAGLKLSEICFSETGRSINEIVKMLGKKICEHAIGVEAARKDILDDVIKALGHRVIEFKDVISTRIEACRKTLGHLDLDIPREAEARMSICSYRHQFRR